MDANNVNTSDVPTSTGTQPQEALGGNATAVDPVKASQLASVVRTINKRRKEIKLIQRIQKMKPTAVIVSNFQYFTEPGGYSSRAQWWNEGQRRLLADLQGSSKNLIYISDTPHPLRDIPNCLATRNVKDCNTTEKTPNVIINGFKKIDPTSWLCTDICPAIKDGYVAYRDASHISVEAALALTSQLETALRDKGLFS